MCNFINAHRERDIYSSVQRFVYWYLNTVVLYIVILFMGGFILFSNHRVCVDFSGSFYFFPICGPFLGS